MEVLSFNDILCDITAEKLSEVCKEVETKPTLQPLSNEVLSHIDLPSEKMVQDSKLLPRISGATSNMQFLIMTLESSSHALAPTF